MERLGTAIAILVLLAFTAMGVHNIVGTSQQLQLRDVQLQDTNAELKKLQGKYDTLLIELDEAQGNADRIKELEAEKQKLDEERQRLERELSAKREAQRIARERANNAASITPKASAASNDKYDLMRAAGIPEGDWRYVDEIISRESDWRHTVWNSTGSGAYGLCQSLPASKMASAGSDYMSNPVTQLRWCHGYAQGYGSWQAAAAFSRCVGSCYSARTGSTVYKDHAWW